VAATKRQRVLSVLEQSARSIRHLEQPVLARILPVLRLAHAEIETDLMAWLSRESGDALFTTQRYRNVLAQLREAFDTVHRLQPTVHGALWEGADRAGELSTKNIVRELEEFGRIFTGTVQPVSIDAAAIIANGDKLLIRRFASSAQKYAGDVGDRVRVELAISRSRSESIFELTNRMQRRLPAMFEADRWDAERLSRTETINAYSEYHLEGLRQINEDDSSILARWDASYDYRRCRMCGSLDGQVRNVAKGDKFVAIWTSVSRRGKARQHRLEVEKPPAHPCCRCCLTPWREDWGEVARTAEPPSGPRDLS